MNNFPPLFPSSKYLEKKSWHRAIFLLSYLYAACSLYSFVLTFLVLLNSLGITSFNINIVLTWPMVLPLSPLMLVSKPNHHLGTNISYPVFQDPNWGLIILLIYFFVSTFLPSIIYKFILQVTLGKKWRGK